MMKRSKMKDNSAPALCLGVGIGVGIDHFHAVSVSAYVARFRYRSRYRLRADLCRGPRVERHDTRRVWPFQYGSRSSRFSTLPLGLRGKPALKSTERGSL